MPNFRRSASYLTRGRWTIADARAALAGWRKSGLSVCAFAQREGIAPARLYRWRRRLAADTAAVEPTPEFVELRRSGVDGVEVVLRSGWVLRANDTIQPSTLARLAHALEPESC